MILHMTAADLSKWVSFGPCRVTNLTGFNNQATDLYIQLHQQSAASSSVNVANTTVPTGGSLLAQSKNGFAYFFPNGGIDLNELCIAISTTQPALTLVGANGGIDLVVEVEGPYLVNSNIHVVGDLTTNVANLEVWAEAVGPKRLMKLDVINKDAAVRYVIGCAQDNQPAGSKAQFINTLQATGDANGLDILHGSSGGGFIPFEKTADQVIHQGFWVSTYTTPSTSGVFGTACIRAIYSDV